MMFKCCGAKGVQDYLKKLGTPPNSCCNKDRAPSLCKKGNPLGKANAYTQGCSEAYKKFANNNFLIILIVVLSIAFIELLGLIFAICLCCNVRSRERAYQTVETH